MEDLVGSKGLFESVTEKPTKGVVEELKEVAKEGFGEAFDEEAEVKMSEHDEAESVAISPSLPLGTENCKLIQRG